MTNELDQFRNKASKQSLGLSSDDIVETIIGHIVNLPKLKPKKILDIGCGTGNLLNRLASNFPDAALFGIDYSEFSSWSKHSKITFMQHDCNQDLPDSLDEFDLIVSSEVIEHIENGRHFVRQLTQKLSLGGVMIISTPNIESFTSLLSFYFRGVHSAFGKKDYPAHILPVAAYDLKNMLTETRKLDIEEVVYIQNGRIPKMEMKWKSVFPFLKGKRFCDNYFIKSKRIK